MKKIAFMFGAGAEMSYDLPSGGDFALNIFKQDTTDSKRRFREMRDAVPSNRSYTRWLHEKYKTKSISAFGRRAYEEIIRGTVEQNRVSIIRKLEKFDDLAGALAQQMQNSGVNVESAFEEVTNQTVEDSYMGADIRFNSIFTERNDTLFASHYYSALLIAYKTLKKDTPDVAKELGKVVSAILQLEIGALGESLVNELNGGLFDVKDDELDILDDLGDIIHLDYQAVGLSGFEYLLENHEDHLHHAPGIILAFARRILHSIYASVLDYKTLIDSNWMYLYQPNKEWGKFCRIAIFLLNTQAYMNSLLERVDLSRDGYYNDIRKAVDAGEVEIIAVGTSNYTDLADTIIGCPVSHLNGSLSLWYDPYLNRIGSEEEFNNSERHIIVPLLFTQSGTKPMISIEMSKQYVQYYDALCQADEICVIGFGFNADDEHINGMFRELIDKQNKNVTIIRRQDSDNDVKTKNEIARQLKVANTDNITVIKVDDNRNRNGINWLRTVLSIPI